MQKKMINMYMLSIIFFIVDQITKFYLTSNLIVNQSIIVIDKILNITYVRNTGAAFSILSGNRLFLILIAVVAIIILGIYVHKLQKLDYIDLFSYSLLFGGIFGNLFDRIIHGYVIDYISLNIFGYYFPIFNFADMCIVLSVILIFITTIKGELWKK